MASSDRIDIASSTNRFIEVEHSWKSQQKFEGGYSTVRTMPDPLDSTLNAASTEWVNNFFEGRIPTTPTINVPLLTPMWFDHTCDSTAWVKSEYDRTVENPCWLTQKEYDTIYTHLVLDVNGKVAVDETVAGVTVHSVVTANDGHKIILSSIDDGDDNTLFNTCGVAWYYVLDTTNKRFKLPRTRYGLQGVKSGGYVGKYDAPGLPNITAQNHLAQDENSSWGVGWGETPTGAFTWRDLTQTARSKSNPGISDTDNVRSWGYLGIGFDASKSNSIYGSSTTVQPPATEMYLYFSTGDESAGGVGVGVGGGVIDGTLLLEKTNIAVTTSMKEVSYTVQNDCLLCIIPNAGDFANSGVTVRVNDAIVANLGDIDSANDAKIVSASVPVKKSSIVKIVSRVSGGSVFDVAGDIDFYEYALNSLAPQIAMPDWDTNKKKSIENGETITENGWLNCFLPRHGGARYQAAFSICINGITVLENSSHVITTFFSFQEYNVVPVSKGDIITYTTEQSSTGEKVKVDFYPCKTIQQSNPPVYITERKHGLYADEFSTTTVYAVGDYYKVTSGATVTYYRVTSAGTGSAAGKTVVQESEVPTWCYTIYSDGYCEQNGRMKYYVTQGANTITVKLKKTFKDTSYIVSLTATSSGQSIDDGHVINEVQSSRTASAFGFNIRDVNGSTADAWNCWEAKGFVM